MARSRIFFDTLQSAAEGLIEVLEYARNNRKVDFTFGPMKAHDVLASGLWIDGQVDDLADNLEQVSGAVRHNE